MEYEKTDAKLESEADEHIFKNEQQVDKSKVWITFKDELKIIDKLKKSQTKKLVTGQPIQHNTDDINDDIISINR